MTISKGRRHRLSGPACLWLAGMVLAVGATSSSDEALEQRLDLTLVIQEGGPGRATATEHLEVWLGDQRQQIEHAAMGRIATDAADDGVTWQTVVYFDAPLASPDGLRQAAKLLEKAASRLTDMGSTEIVLADPRPAGYLETTRSSEAVEEALQDLRRDALTTGDLLWNRQRHTGLSAELGESQRHQAWRRETEIIQRQRAELLLWLSERRLPGPKLLILVQNGFDLNPGEFYGRETAESFLEDPREVISQSALSRSLAAAGWTVVALALGPRAEEFANPLAPLFDVARATGGEVVTSRREGLRLLRKISSWPILEVTLATTLQTATLPLRVVDASSGRTLPTRQWTALGPELEIEAWADRAPHFGSEAAPVLQLLRPEGLTHAGTVRFRTITGHQRIHRVAFLLDGETVAETRRSPYSAEIDLGIAVVPHEISALAFSRSGRQLGGDTLQLNMALEPPTVSISELRYAPDEGFLELRATVSRPSGTGPDRVEIFLNQSRQALLTEPPYEVRFPVESLKPEDFVRVVALYPDGETAEAARLPAVSGPADELDVNLVELLAMVTPRNRRATLDLGKADFVIRQRGRALPIDHFSRWEDLQLTLGLVLDTSDSMDAILEDAREAGERFFQQAMNTGDEAFVVDFNYRPRLARRITADSDELLDSLVGLEARGMTALYDAIVFSLQQFENTAGRRALVVVTDGEDSASHFQPRECVRQARLHGVPVYLIVLGTPPDPHRDPELLRNLMIARRTGGEVYYISDLDDLGRIYEQIADELRRQYSLAFDAGHTLTPEELQEIEIEVVPKGVEVRTLLASQHRGG